MSACRTATAQVRYCRVPLAAATRVNPRRRASPPRPTPSGNALPITARCSFIAAMLTSGIIIAASTPRAGRATSDRWTQVKRRSLTAARKHPTPRPEAGHRIPLANLGLVLEPDFERPARCALRRENTQSRTARFFKNLPGHLVAPRALGVDRYAAEVQGPQRLANRALVLSQCHTVRTGDNGLRRPSTG